MKKIISLLLLFIALGIHAQGEHMKFMGIPIAGNPEAFVEKLVKDKGFELIDTVIYEADPFSSELHMVEGSYESFDSCLVIVRKIDQLKEISSVIVAADSIKYADVCNELETKFEKKYGAHQLFVDKKLWKQKNGYIISGFESGSFTICFMNKPEVEIREGNYNKYLEKVKDSLANVYLENAKKEQTVREICGIPFGTSYEKAEEILRNKYGYPKFSTDRTTITYDNKTYAGIMFDSIHFLFQSDGINSYMNGCVFIINTKTVNEAKMERDRLHDKLSEKYFMSDNTDKNGFKYYIGGFSPTDNTECAFCIDIVKYDSELAKHTNIYYSARLAYGRFNYVKEEF